MKPKYDNFAQDNPTDSIDKLKQDLMTLPRGSGDGFEDLLDDLIQAARIETRRELVVKFSKERDEAHEMGNEYRAGLTQAILLTKELSDEQ